MRREANWCDRWGLCFHGASVRKPRGSWVGGCPGNGTHYYINMLIRCFKDGFLLAKFSLLSKSLLIDIIHPSSSLRFWQSHTFVEAIFMYCSWAQVKQKGKKKKTHCQSYVKRLRWHRKSTESVTIQGCVQVFMQKLWPPAWNTSKISRSTQIPVWFSQKNAWQEVDVSAFGYG